VRNRYWKNRANYAQTGQFSEANLARMKKGLAPLFPDSKGNMVPMELHHIIPQSEGGLFYFAEIMPEEHAAIDSYRYLGD